jgi:hypothetical protein
MNTALGDSFDIGWKLAAVLSGCGGERLLTSYEVERKPVAVRNIDHSGVHWSVHSTCWRWITNGGREHVTAPSAEGNELRSKIKEYLYRFDGENEDQGIELGYRYNRSPVVVPDKGVLEPPWNERQYIPSTWPGARAPHVFAGWQDEHL